MSSNLTNELSPVWPNSRDQDNAAARYLCSNGRIHGQGMSAHFPASMFAHVHDYLHPGLCACCIDERQEEGSWTGSGSSPRMGVYSLHYQFPGENGRRLHSRTLWQGIYSFQHTLYVINQLPLVWYNLRCAMAKQEIQEHSTILLRAIYFSCECST